MRIASPGCGCGCVCVRSFLSLLEKNWLGTDELENDGDDKTEKALNERFIQLQSLQERRWTNQWTGLTSGNTANTVSPTKPLVDETTPSGCTSHVKPTKWPTVHDQARSALGLKDERSSTRNAHLRNTRSAKVTSAQTFPAQYAWLSPLVKGKSRLAS